MSAEGNDLRFEMSVADALESARSDRTRYHLRQAHQHEIIARDRDGAEASDQ